MSPGHAPRELQGVEGQGVWLGEGQLPGGTQRHEPPPEHGRALLRVQLLSRLLARLGRHQDPVTSLALLLLPAAILVSRLGPAGVVAGSSWGGGNLFFINNLVLLVVNSLVLFFACSSFLVGSIFLGWCGLVELGAGPQF